MRLLLQLGQQRLPVADAVGFHPQQVDVRRGAQQPVLKVLAESVIDGQRDDERGHACRDSYDRDDGDDANDGLAAFGPEIPRGNKEFELHRYGAPAASQNGEGSL